MGMDGSRIIESKSSQCYRRYNLKPEDKKYSHKTYRLHIFEYKYERFKKQESKLKTNKNGHLNDGTDDLSKIRWWREQRMILNDGQLPKYSRATGLSYTYPRFHSIQHGRSWTTWDCANLKKKIWSNKRRRLNWAAQKLLDLFVYLVTVLRSYRAFFSFVLFIFSFLSKMKTADFALLKIKSIK